MTTIENQYAYFFSLLGYKTEFFPEKQLFYLPEVKTYCKICDDPAPPDILAQADTYSKKHDIILLEGPLTFRTYNWFFKEGSMQGMFIRNGYKYHPLYWTQDYDPEWFPEEAKITAMAIRCGEDVVCHQCGSINDFIITKPSIHYKATCRCGAYITNISENKPSYFFFGKYKDRSVKSMHTNEEIQYLQWGINQNIFKGKLKKDVMERLSEI